MPAQLVRLESAPDLVEQVYRALLDAICDGTLAAGARITQEDIAAQLAVSRQPVLQALRLLKQDGFVIDAQGRGVCVAGLDITAIRQVYEVRGALDALAARLAARQGAVLDPRLIEQGRKAMRGRNVRAMIDADLAFHAAIYAASGNPMIEASAQRHWQQLRRVMGAVLSLSGQRETVWDEHARIADAIAKGEASRAEQLIANHVEHASANLAERLAISPLPPIRTGGHTP